MNAENTTFAQVVDASRKIWTEFDRVEERPWSIEVVTIELMKQSGDLAKRILTHEGYYLHDRLSRPEYASDVADIGNELADILHQIIRISDYYNIDLLSAHFAARQGEQRYLQRVCLSSKRALSDTHLDV